jgi:hypothetical protein
MFLTAQAQELFGIAIEIGNAYESQSFIHQVYVSHRAGSPF